MSFRHRPFDRAAAETMLNGVPAGRHATPDPLANVLAAAAAPGHAYELTGEGAATVAFQAARLGSADPPRTVARRTGTLRRIFAVKLAAVFAATAAASIAVAAGTGVIPNPIDIRAGVPSASTSPAPKAGPRSPTPDRSAASTGSSSAGSPSLVGLCRAFLAADPHGKRAENPAFAELVAAAGGKNEIEIETFCAGVLAAAPDYDGPPAKGEPPGTGPPTAIPSQSQPQQSGRQPSDPPSER